MAMAPQPLRRHLFSEVVFLEIRFCILNINGQP